jgi:hypothetical protein
MSIPPVSSHLQYADQTDSDRQSQIRATIAQLKTTATVNQTFAEILGILEKQSAKLQDRINGMIAQENWGVVSKIEKDSFCSLVKNMQTDMKHQLENISTLHPKDVSHYDFSLKLMDKILTQSRKNGFLCLHV